MRYIWVMALLLASGCSDTQDYNTLEYKLRERLSQLESTSTTDQEMIRLMQRDLNKLRWEAKGDEVSKLNAEVKRYKDLATSRQWSLDAMNKELTGKVCIESGLYDNHVHENPSTGVTIGPGSTYIFQNNRQWSLDAPPNLPVMSDAPVRIPDTK